MSNGMEQQIDDTNIMSIEMALENTPHLISKFWFYKCKSIIKEQKARIVLENNATSVLCIETNVTDLSPDKRSLWKNKELDLRTLPNGFATTGAIIGERVVNSKLNYIESSMQLKYIDQPTIDINHNLDFLIDEIYVVSLDDLTGQTRVNPDRIFLIENSENLVPKLVVKDNPEQWPNSTLELISLTNYNAQRTHSASVNITSPVSIDDIKPTDTEDPYLRFQMNSDLILFSNIQFFGKFETDNFSTEKITSCNIDVETLDNLVTTKLPVKMSVNQDNIGIQWINEWSKLVLPWTTAKKYFEQDDLENLLTIDEIPDIEAVYNNVKIVSMNIKTEAEWRGNNNSTLIKKYTTESIITNQYLPLKQNKFIEQTDISGQNPPLYNFGFLQENDVNFQGNNTNFNLMSALSGTNNNLITLQNSDGSTFNVNGSIDRQLIYFDFRNEQNFADELFNFPLINTFAPNSFVITHMNQSQDLNFISLIYSPNSISKTFTAPPRTGFSRQINTQFKISNYLYPRLIVSNKPTTDTKILVKFMKELLRYTINYRLGFPDALYDENNGNNPINDMAKLKEEFRYSGTNPLEVVSNRVNSFVMLNPWIVKLPEWQRFKECVAMLSSNIYSTYSLGTGVREYEAPTLPYYFELLSPAVKVDFGGTRGYIYDYQSLQVVLKSEFFDFTQLTNTPYDGSPFRKFPNLNSQMVVETENFKIAFPFIGATLSENYTSKIPDKINIEEMDYQKYLMYFIATIDSTRKFNTNAEVFDDYMEHLMSYDNHNYAFINQKWRDFSCRILPQIYSPDNSIIGDLPTELDFTYYENGGDDLTSDDGSIRIFKSRGQQGDIINQNENFPTINIVKEPK